MPFAPVLVGETTVPDNLYIIFALFVTNAAFSYALNYRRPLLIADQKGFITNLIVTACSIILYGLKIFILLATQNFYLYTLVTVLAKILEDAIVNIVVQRRYPYITEKYKLDKHIKTDVKKKMHGSIYHNTATYIVFSTDNIIISQIFGVINVGLYANYHMVLNSINLILNQIFSAMTASLGNILVNEGPQKLHIMARRIILLNFFIYAPVSIATYFCITPFVKLWLGPDFLFIDAVTIALILSFYLQAARAPISNVLASAGIIYETRFVPIFEASINLVASIALALLIGLPGVFIGTAISHLFLHLYSYPKYAASVLKHSRAEYTLLFLKYFGLFIATWVAMGGVISFVNIDNNILNFTVKGLLSVSLPILLFWIIFRKTEEFQYFASIGKRVLRKKLLRRKY